MKCPKCHEHEAVVLFTSIEQCQVCTNTDLIVADMQEKVMAALANAPGKIPYTDGPMFGAITIIKVKL